MRKLTTNEAKFRTIADLYAIIDGLENTFEEEDNEKATLAICIKESGEKIDRVYGRDGITSKPYPLDIDTRNCIVDALKSRLKELKEQVLSDNRKND
jgi:hypothetical protein